jgi:hypothetical protein
MNDGEFKKEIVSSLKQISSAFKNMRVLLCIIALIWILLQIGAISYLIVYGVDINLF